MLVRQRDLDTLAALDHMIVRQDQTLLIQDEAGALPLLRHRPIEEVELNRCRGDVDDARQGLLVDGNILLLFGVKGSVRSKLPPEPRSDVVVIEDVAVEAGPAASCRTHGMAPVEARCVVMV